MTRSSRFVPTTPAVMGLVGRFREAVKREDDDGCLDVCGLTPGDIRDASDALETLVLQKEELLRACDKASLHGWLDIAPIRRILGERQSHDRQE